MAEYSMIPVEVPSVSTPFRTIQTQIPVPESIPLFETLKQSEPRSMMGQPPVVWDRADGCIICDKWGNRWIDWSSGVLVTNSGHGHPEIRAALEETIHQGLLATYVFVHEKRAELTRMLKSLSPDPKNYTVFLLTTGSEATENCIKLSRTYAMKKVGREKKIMVTFEHAFHGRTLGAQLAGGMTRLKDWIGNLDPTFIQVPFPDGYKNEDVSFELFLKTLEEKGIRSDEIAGVMAESYQGVGPDFLPVEYARQLEVFCRQHDIIFTVDEIQSGFGRTGKMFCYEHYGIRPDLIACGKGISSSLPLSAVIGRKDIMDLYAPGSMTSTHSGSPLPVAAAVANLKVIQKEGLTERAAEMGEILLSGLERIQNKYPERLGCLHGKGLVAGVQVVKRGTKTPDSETAFQINLSCFQKGLLMFAPVGIAGECIKICPPLTISEEALRESIQVFEEAVDDVMSRGENT